MSYRFGRYEAIRAIANGGMAQVFEGRVTDADGFERQVAIKSVFPHLQRDPDFVRMFLDEARIAARLHHPNVVGTHDAQQDKARLFLVMDYVDGPTLQQTLTHLDGPRPISITLGVYTNALKGLHAVHGLVDKSGRPLNLVQRDLTPHNILLSQGGAVKIANFGIALADSRLVHAEKHAIEGKPTYLAPEQLSEAQPTYRADTHAVGVGLWECLGGRKMFPGLPATEVARRARRGSIPPLPDSIPGPLSHVVHTALHRNPSERFHTARQFADALVCAAKAVGMEPANSLELGRFLSETETLAKHDRKIAQFSRNNPLPRTELNTADDLELELHDALDDSTDNLESSGSSVRDLLFAPAAPVPPKAPLPRPAGSHGARLDRRPPQAMPVSRHHSHDTAPPTEGGVPPPRTTTSFSPMLWACLALFAAAFFVLQIGPALSTLLTPSNPVQAYDFDEGVPVPTATPIPDAGTRQSPAH